MRSGVASVCLKGVEARCVRALSATVELPRSGKPLEVRICRCSAHKRLLQGTGALRGSLLWSTANPFAMCIGFGSNAPGPLPCVCSDLLIGISE